MTSDLKYSLIIETTDDPSFFGFYSPDLEGFSGVGQSVEDCIVKARQGMEEHVAILAERGLTVPPPNMNPIVTIKTSKSVLPAA